MSILENAPERRLVDRIAPGPSPREKYLETEVAAVEDVLSQILMKLENFDIDMADGTTASMHEALQSIDLMLDAQGWTNVFEYDEDRGLTLRQVKEASRQIRELLVGNPFIINGLRIRYAQTWAGGVEFGSKLRSKNEYREIPVETQRLMETYAYQRYIFGNKPKRELESAVFSDGNLFFLGRDSDRQIQRIQVHEITGMMHNPNNSEEVWAYRRSWTPDFQNRDVAPEQRVRWYYTEAVPLLERRTRIRGLDGRVEIAEPGYTMLDFQFNRQIGWPLGVPDALCVVAWARLYKEFLVNGYVMSRSLARLAYKLTAASAKGANKAALEIAQPGQAGSTFIEGANNQLTALSTAGRGYDFSSGNVLAGSMAAGLGVSLLALLSNPAAATGSNAAAQTLDPIAKATAQARRSEWEDDLARLFRYMGMDRRLVVTWHDLREDNIHRTMQAWTLVDQMELFKADVLQEAIAKEMDIAMPGDVPPGWKPKSQRGVRPADSTGGNSGATGGSGQGADDGSGGSQDDHDDDN